MFCTSGVGITRWDETGREGKADMGNEGKEEERRKGRGRGKEGRRQARKKEKKEKEKNYDLRYEDNLHKIN